MASDAGHRGSRALGGHDGPRSESQASGGDSAGVAGGPLIDA